MYEVVDIGSLDNFKSKIDINQRGNYGIDCLGGHHVVHKLQLTDNGMTELLYQHTVRGDTFKIPFHWARISYDVTIDKQNRLYQTLLHAFLARPYRTRNNDKMSMNITEHDKQIVGITVGDLLKHYYITAGVDGVDADDTEKQMYYKYCKRAMAVNTDDVTAELPQVLGMLHDNRIFPWTDIARSNDDGSFQHYCKKILFFSNSFLHRLFSVNSALHNQPVFYDCHKIFNNLSNEQIITKLMRYYLYGEDPEIETDPAVLYFSEPKSVQEILLELTEKDSTIKRTYELIMSELNHREEELLAEKYLPTVFRSIRLVPKEYPAYAFRNISVMEWHKWDDTDIWNYERDYQYRKKISKCKYRMTADRREMTVNKCHDRYERRERREGRDREHLPRAHKYNYEYDPKI